jgi:AcrR family transcriptional regulator
MAAGDPLASGQNDPTDAVNQRRQRADRRREELLDAADAVVRRVGPKVSATLIAKEAGVTKPIIYRHFGDIQDLYHALAVRHERRLGQLQLEARLRDADLDRFGRFRSVVAAFFEVIESEPALYRFLVHTGGDVPNQEGALSWFTREWAGDIARHLAAIAGEPEGSPRARAMGFAMAGALTTAGSWWLEERATPSSVFIDAVTELLIYGLPQPTEEYELPAELPDR